MKKNLFYAAFALAMMASCTNEDNLVVDPVNPTPDAEDKVAIELGIDAPSVNATLNPRSTGSVGGTNETGDENNWNGQKLYITMVNKNTNVVTPVSATDATPLLGYNSYKYFAPKGNAKEKISIVGQFVETGQQSGVDKEANIYYPTQGTFDFYGWHVDDIETALPSQSNPLLIEGIKITGQQDIMGARTKEFTEENYGNKVNQNFKGDFTQMIGWDFSARTARNEIDPILAFEHQLARLKFFVRAGSTNTISDGINYTDVNGKTTTNAMHVTAITVKKMADDLTMDLNSNGTIVTTTTDPETEADEVAQPQLVQFSLLSRGNDGNMMKELEAVAPTYVYDGTDATKGVQVGESVMFFPWGDSKKTIDLSIDLKQYVKLWEDATEPNNAKYWGYKTQNANLKVHATSVVVDENGTKATEFEAGKSYNVYITVYGFEKIEVTAELTAWEMGGDVDVDIEEGESKHNVDVAFVVGGLANGVTPEITVKQHKDAQCATDTEVTATNGKYNVESFSTLHYTIKAQGYETVEGVVNAENGKTVTITMKADTGTPGPTSKDVKVKVTGLPDDVTANVSVTPTGGEALRPNADGTYTLIYDTEYTITATYDGYTATSIILTAGESTQAEIEVAMTQSQAPATSKNVTVKVEGLPEDGSVEVNTIVTPENSSALNANPDGKYTLVYGTKYTITAKAEGYTAVPVEVTAGEETEDEITVTMTKN